ncbi:MAG: Asp23/Gls24 family envelope stress response protein [Lapillicoccus sp.]
MTDAATLAAPGERGRTVIEEAVLESIAVRASGEVPGVVVQAGSGLAKVIGHQYPKADADVAGTRARLRVDVAIRWPYPLADVTAQVRDSVTARLTELTGLTIDAVDVTAAKVVHDQRPTPRRVQ